MASHHDNHLRKVLLPPSDSAIEEEHKRLWIGNLDPRISEFHLLKLLQKHGTIDKFDLLLHRSGPQAGQPRGYAFCTYTEARSASLAQRCLDGLIVGSRKIAVCWAHTMTKAEIEGTKPEMNIPALGGAKAETSTKRPISRQITIQAIEAKLKLMEYKDVTEEFEIDNSPAAFKAKPYALLAAQSNSVQHNKPTHSRNTHRNHERKPYKMRRLK